MLYRIILLIFISFSDIEFCAKDNWSFVESLLLKVKACIDCVEESIKKIVAMVNMGMSIQFST
jgi:hypothetical protein